MRHKKFLLGGLGFVVAVAVGCGDAEPGSGVAGGGTAGSSGASTSGGTSATAGTGAVGNGGTSPSAGTSANAGSVSAGGDVGVGGEPPLNDGPLLPWAVGNAWTYRVTKNGTSTDKTTTVGGLEAVGGSGPNAQLMANHVVTAKGASLSDKSESWQAPAADEPRRILRFRELAFDTAGKLTSETYYAPSKIHIDGTDAHTLKSAQWTEKYTETVLPVGMPMTSRQASDSWLVVDDNETLTVPAGTFMRVVHFRKTGTSVKEYWFVRGVGKLKETGTQTEELVSYSLK